MSASPAGWAARLRSDFPANKERQSPWMVRVYSRMPLITTRRKRGASSEWVQIAPRDGIRITATIYESGDWILDAATSDLASGSCHCPSTHAKSVARLKWLRRASWRAYSLAQSEKQLAGGVSSVKTFDWNCVHKESRFRRRTCEWLADDKPTSTIYPDVQACRPVSSRSMYDHIWCKRASGRRQTSCKSWSQTSTTSSVRRAFWPLEDPSEIRAKPCWAWLPCPAFAANNLSFKSCRSK